MNRRGNFTFGVLLILVGAFFMASNLVPDLGNWISQYTDWPYFIVGGGVVMLVAGLTSGVYGMAIPSMILIGVGNILAYQNRTNDWQSWSYAWALIMVSIGIGIFISNIMKGKTRKAFREGGNMIVSGFVTFLLLGTFFRFIFNQDPLLGDYWPVILIAAGFWELIKPLLSKKPNKSKVTVSMTTEGDEGEFQVDVDIIEPEVEVEVVEENEAVEEFGEESLDDVE
jgi:hypothetical protein